jgi:hypothetical protein
VHLGHLRPERVHALRHQAAIRPSAEVTPTKLPVLKSAIVPFLVVTTCASAGSCSVTSRPSRVFTISESPDRLVMVPRMRCGAWATRER